MNFDLIYARKREAAVVGFTIFAMGTLCAVASVPAPVLWVTIKPRALVARLILSVVRVVKHLVALPAKASFTLTYLGRAKCLVRDLRVDDEYFATACADSRAHQISPFESSHGRHLQQLAVSENLTCSEFSHHSHLESGFGC